MYIWVQDGVGATVGAMVEFASVGAAVGCPHETVVSMSMSSGGVQ